MKLKLFRYLLIVIASLVIFFATKYAFANLSYLKVDSYLSRWQSTKMVETGEMQDALDSVDTMLTLHGHFPHYLNVAAKVYEWLAYSRLAVESDLDSSETSLVKNTSYQTSLLQALEYYKQSTALRSHWPLTWVFMANIKANLNQFDDDFYYYIEQAMKYGPYTHEVNLQVAKLQLLYWGKLKRLPVKVGLEQIKRALVNNRSRDELLNYALELQKVTIVCTVARINQVEAATQHRICK